MKKITKYKAGLILFLALVCVPIAGAAVNIPITNGSFENPVLTQVPQLGV